MSQVRERGYAVDIEENETGVRCAAVPIFLGRIVPAAAVSVTLLSTRAEPRRLAELGEHLRGAAAEFAAAAGAKSS